MPNIEIKARYADLAKGRRIAESLNAKRVGRDHQVDTYFRTREGRLKLRESSLSGAQLIPYRRADAAGPKLSEYAVLPIQDPALIKPLLVSLLGVGAIVEKDREIFLIDNVRVHLDSVFGLGNFLEFEAVFEDATGERIEAETAKVRELMGRFGITEADLETGSYRELVTVPPN